MPKKYNAKKMCDELMGAPEEIPTIEPKRSKWRDLDVRKVGRPKNIKDPEELLVHFKNYVIEVDENPFMKQEVLKGGQAAGKIIGVPTIRPYTWTGLDTYLSNKGLLAKLEDYKANSKGNYAEFSDTIAYIGKLMYDQKFSGAAVGAFNANIIASDLGLVAKSQIDVKTEQPLFGED
jgi:hypothetical protein